MPQNQKFYWCQHGDLCYKSPTPQDNKITIAESFHKQLDHIQDLTFPQLLQLVQDGFHPKNVEFQYTLLFHAMHWLLGGKEPHKQQVRVLHQLVYQLGDTILVAKTGFGKSIVFHAFSILTGWITIQLIPLSRLGEEQMALIHWYPGTSPCLVVADTKFRNPRLLEEIKAGMYTHILLGPEQATSPEFCKGVTRALFPATSWTGHNWWVPCS